jgi:hypothetical protein
MLRATVSADRRFVVPLLLLIVPFLSLFVQHFGGICLCGGLIFDQLHHFLHGIRCAFDEHFHLAGVVC